VCRGRLKQVKLDSNSWHLHKYLVFRRERWRLKPYQQVDLLKLVNTYIIVLKTGVPKPTEMAHFIDYLSMFPIVPWNGNSWK